MAARYSPQSVCFESREGAALLIKAASELGCKGPEANGVRETHTHTQLRDSDGENSLEGSINFFLDSCKPIHNGKSRIQEIKKQNKRESRQVPQ